MQIDSRNIPNWGVGVAGLGLGLGTIYLCRKTLGSAAQYSPIKYGLPVAGAALLGLGAYMRLKKDQPAPPPQARDQQAPSSQAIDLRKGSILLPPDPVAKSRVDPFGGVIGPVLPRLHIDFNRVSLEQKPVTVKPEQLLSLLHKIISNQFFVMAISEHPEATVKTLDAFVDWFNKNQKLPEDKRTEFKTEFLQEDCNASLSFDKNGFLQLNTLSQFKIVDTMLGKLGPLAWGLPIGADDIKAFSRSALGHLASTFFADLLRSLSDLPDSVYCCGYQQIVPPRSTRDLRSFSELVRLRCTERRSTKAKKASLADFLLSKTPYLEITPLQREKLADFILDFPLTPAIIDQFDELEKTINDLKPGETFKTDEPLQICCTRNENMEFEFGDSPQLHVHFLRCILPTPHIRAPVTGLSFIESYKHWCRENYRPRLINITKKNGENHGRAEHRS